MRKKHLWHEQGRSGSSGVSDRSQNVHLFKARERMNRVEHSPKRLVENIANPGAAAQLRGLNISGSALDRLAIGRGELGDDLQQRLALVGNVVAVRVQQRLELRSHHIYSRLQF